MDRFDELPCPVLVTDGSGQILAVNAHLLDLLGSTRDQWLGRSMDALFPLPSRIFLQTHVWPMLFREGQVHEIRLEIFDRQQARLPVLANCRKFELDGEQRFYWVLFVAFERSRFEAELLEARNRAQTTAQALAKSEQFVRVVTDALPGMIAYWNRDLRCGFANQPYLLSFGRTWVEMSGAAMQDVLDEHMFAVSLPYIRGVLAGKAQEFERQSSGPDGSVAHALISYVPDTDAHGVVNGFFATLTNITRLKEAETAMRLAASVFEIAGEGILITDAQGFILSVNPAFTQITGFSGAEVVGRTPRILKSDRHAPAFHAALWRSMVDTGRWEGDIWNQRKDASLFLARQSISAMRDDAGEVLRYVAVFNDVTERWGNEQLVHHQAMHDTLTGLPNRALLMERLGQLVAIATRETRAIAVLFLDLDGFKAVNDTLGHAAGDEVLRVVAQRLRAQRRQTDTVARLGGDEFVVLLDDPASREIVEQIAAHMIEMIRQPIDILEQQAHVGASIGVALNVAAGVAPKDMIKNADTAMYAAKAAGKNTFRFAGDS